jgi:glycosyltransferase involved in cell wall biosynthesis
MSRFGFDRFTDAGFRSLYVPHAIDVDLFTPDRDKAAIRDKLGLRQDDFVIGVNAANNDAIRKAAPEMFLAFAKFHATHPDTILAVHAGVHQEGGQDLEVLAENLGITDRVRVVDQYHYHAGMVSAKELADWYCAIDVLAACTYAEGFGLPIIEAQACGIPVITTKASSMEELNPHGGQVDGTPFWNGVHKGWWIRPDLAEMVNAFEDAYQKREDVNGEKLREFALEYSIENVAEKYMSPAIAELANRMAAKRG